MWWLKLQNIYTTVTNWAIWSSNEKLCQPYTRVEQYGAKNRISWYAWIQFKFFVNTAQCNNEYLKKKNKDDGAEVSLISRTASSVGTLSSEIGQFSLVGNLIKSHFEARNRFQEPSLELSSQAT
jgi:hypothetical protein